MSLGVTARAKGNLDEAIEHCNRALELWARLGQERSANRVLNNIGDVHYAAGRRAQAWDFQERCLIRSRELHDDFSIGCCALELARYALDDGKPDLAVSFAREGEAGAQRSGDHMREAMATAIEGVAAERFGRKSIANRQFRTAMTMLLEREVGAKLAEVCTMYADVLRGRGEADRAFAFMRMAAEREFSRLPALLGARK